nr:hypothetical protein [uncultured Mediterranean phage uvMED]
MRNQKREEQKKIEHMSGYRLSRSKANLDAQISMLSEYIAELQASLAHYQKAKELING